MEKEKYPEFIAGSTQTLEFYVLDKNQPVDLSLFTANLYICPFGDKSYSILEKSVEIVSPTEGKCRVVLLPSDTANFDEGYYMFQFKVSQGSENVQILEGTWFIRGVIG